MDKVNNTFHNRLILTGIIFFVIGVIFYLTFQIVKPFFGVIATAVVFTIFIKPIYNILLDLTGKSGLSSFLTVLTLILFMIIPLGLLISNLLSEALAISRSIQNNSEWVNSFQTNVEYQLGLLNIPIQASDLNLNEQIYQSLSFLTRSLGGVALRSGGMLLNLFFILITIYFFLTEQNKIRDYTRDLKLFPNHYLKLISSRVIEIVNGTVRGYLLVVLLQTIVGIIGFLLMQVPAALLLGSLYGFSSLLPLVGGFLLWIPVVAWQLATGNITTAIFLTGWFLILSFAVENIIAPRIIGQKTKLHQLVVMFSVFGGIQYFGLIGMVLGPVVIALAFVAISILKEIANLEKVKPDKAIQS